MTPSDLNIRNACLDMQHSIILQAPAGSGKTTILIKRYLKSLTLVDNPEAVIAITFTRKAAHEMLTRVLLALQNPNDILGQAVLAHSQKLNWELNSNPSRLRITTIDALCASITAKAPYASLHGLPNETTENPESIYRSTVQHYLRDLLQKDNSDELQLLLDISKGNIQKLHAYLVNVLKSRSLFLNSDGGDNLRAFKEDYKIFIRNQLHPYVKEITQYLPYLNSLANNSLENFEDTWQVSCWLCENFTNKSPFQLTKRLPKETYLKNAGLRQEVKDVFLRLNEDANFIHKLSLLKEFIPLYSSLGNTIVVDIFTKVTNNLTAALRKSFVNYGYIDFLQQAIAANHALKDADGNSTDVLLQLDSKIQHILVDEFQDTSIIQWELLELLTLGWYEGDGKTCFFVGDPMQSIYRFRQAEVSLFFKVIDTGLNGIKFTYLQIHENFRSNKALVEKFNQMFNALFPSYRDEYISGAVQYANSKGVVEDDGTAKLEFLLLDNKLPKANVCLDEAIAKKIIEIKSYEPSASIVILIRSRTHVEDLVEVLNQHGIDVDGSDVDLIKDSLPVQDFLNLIRVLKNTADNHAWFALLRTPIFGLSLSEMYRICDRYKNQIFMGLFYEYYERCYQFFKCYFDCLNLVNRQKPFDVVIKLWEGIGGELLYPKSEVARIHVETIKPLISKFHSWAEIEVEKLQESVFRMKKPYAGGLNKNRDKDRDGCNKPVELLTIHKAKGLEFDHVFLYRVDKGVKNSKEEVLSHYFVNLEGRHRLYGVKLDKGVYGNTTDYKLYEFLDNLNKRNLENEMLRQLYVSVTRAKKSLTFTSLGEANAKGDKVKFGSKIAEDIYNLMWEDNIRLVLYNKNPIKEKSINTIINKAVYDKPISEHDSSYYSADKNQYAFNGGDNTALGIFLHLVFYTIVVQYQENNYNFQEINAMEIAKQMLKGQKNNMEANLDILLLEKMVNNFVKSFLPSVISGQEFEFFPEFEISSISNQQRLESHRIDLVIKFKSKILIVDYKFSSGELIREYISQIERYKKLICNLYPNYDIIGQIYFPITNKVYKI